MGDSKWIEERARLEILEKVRESLLGKIVKQQRESFKSFAWRVWSGKTCLLQVALAPSER